MKKLIILLLSFIVISCENREWENPFDPSCPKNIWTPTNFTSKMGTKCVTLNWKNPSGLISGYKLTRVIDNGTEVSLPIQDNRTFTYTDDQIVGGKVHLYKLTAFAGDNESYSLTTQILTTALPTISTANPLSVAASSAVLGGEVISDGGAPVADRGICWSVHENPTIADNPIHLGSGPAVFNYTINQLDFTTTLYYFRAFAVNNQGVAYGNQVSATLATLADLTTISLSLENIGGSKKIQCHYQIKSLGGYLLKTGVCWSFSPNPTIADNCSQGYRDWDHDYSCYISDVIPGATYYVRSYVTNVVGTSYGNELTIIGQ